jgi:hypothetical protein
MAQQNENTEFKEFLEKYKEHWDKFFEEWSKGESHQKKLLKNDKIWSDENRKGKVWKTEDGKEKSTLLEYDVLPQPYLGNIENHSVITLNLNPSRSKKNNENIEFEKNYLPKFKEAENYHEYAERFPTYDTHPFWQNQDKWIDRIFEDLGKEKPSEKKIKPFAIEICPWGSKSFQKLKIKKDDPLIKYMDKHVFDVIEKVIENSKLKIVLSVGKAYYDIFQKSEFKKVEEISSKPFQKEVFKFSNDKYKTHLDLTHLDLSPSENNKLKEKIPKIPYNWPIKFVQRSFSIWEKDGIFYFNTYASGSNSTPGVHFDEIQNQLINKYLNKP